MRYLNLIIFLCLGSQVVMADYGGQFIQFEIRLTNGMAMAGHAYRADAYIAPDSLGSDSYILRELSGEGWDTGSTDSFYSGWKAKKW